MNQKIMINNKKYQMKIFKSLMATEYHLSKPKTQMELNKELKSLENQGKLKLYFPEKTLDK